MGEGDWKGDPKVTDLFLTMEEQNKIIVFQEKQIRHIWHKEEWWFSVVDVIEVLTESSKANRYWADLKKRSSSESEQPFAFCE